MQKKLIDQQILDRFWDKVDKTNSCWLFRNGVKRHDYGTFGFQGRVRKAHIVSWIIHHGDIPKDLCVCHSCDNPPCVNPDHLFLGTKKDNAIDAAQKQRLFRVPATCMTRGINRHNAKLNEKQVKQIRNEHRNGSSYRLLAQKYHVCTRTVGHIVHKRKWKHVN